MGSFTELTEFEWMECCSHTLVVEEEAPLMSHNTCEPSKMAVQLIGLLRVIFGIHATSFSSSCIGEDETASTCVLDSGSTTNVTTLSTNIFWRFDGAPTEHSSAFS
jgi:hypothetical protein